MQVIVNTDRNIEGKETLTAEVEAVVDQVLGRFREHITRIEVHISDENAHKGGSDDKKCVAEARMAGKQPVAVSHNSGTVDQAVDGAMKKLRALLDKTFDKLSDHKGRTSFSGD